MCHRKSSDARPAASPAPADERPAARLWLVIPVDPHLNDIIVVAEVLEVDKLISFDYFSMMLHTNKGRSKTNILISLM